MTSLPDYGSLLRLSNENSALTNDISSALRIVNSNLPYIQTLECKEKRDIICGIYRYFSNASRTFLRTPDIFSVFDNLASILLIQCPSQTNHFLDLDYVISSLIDCLQSRTVTSSSEHLNSVLNFVVALCKCCGESFSWMGIILKGSDFLPFRLLLTVIVIELKLRLPTHLEGLLDTASPDEDVIRSCLEVLSLFITEIAGADNKSATDAEDSITNLLSDESLSTLMKQLLEIGEALATSLTSSITPESTEVPTHFTMPDSREPTPLVLCVLVVYLQWSLYVYQNHFLSVSDKNVCRALFDETIFQPPHPSASKKYKELEERFEAEVWKPLQPLLADVVPRMFYVNNGVGLPDSLTVCRKLLLRLGRLFPAVIGRSFDVNFVESLISHPSDEGGMLLKSRMGMSYLRDVSSLVDILQTVNAQDEPEMVSACALVVGRLTSLLSLGVNWSSVLEPFSEEDSAGKYCEACSAATAASVAEVFFDVMFLLRFLVLNAWQVDVDRLFRALGLSNPATNLPTDAADDDCAAKWICDLVLTVLRQLTKMKPPSLLDYDFSPHRHHAIRAFYIPCTLRDSAGALLQCCHSNCRSNSVFRDVWKLKYAKVKSELRLLKAHS